MGDSKFKKPFSSLPPDEFSTTIQFAQPKSPAGQTSLFDAFDEADKPKRSKPSKEQKAVESNVVEVEEGSMKMLQNVAHQYHLIDTKIKRADLISKLFMQKSVCFDTETTG